MKTVTASAPGKLMISGSYAVVHGRGAVVTAVDQRLYVTVEQLDDEVMILDAPDVGMANYQKDLAELGKGDLPKAVKFIEILYKNFLLKYHQRNGQKKSGLKISTKSDFSSSFGFGSSSAVTVALAKALLGFYDLHLSNKEIFDLCYETVIEVQGVGSGFDLASAIWGGTIYYVSPAKVVTEISIDELPLVVGYAGVKADTPTLVKSVNVRLKNEPDFVNDIFDQVGEISTQVKTALEAKEWADLGKLLNRHQDLMKRLDLSSPELDKLIDNANQAGAFGSAFSGAGGGDCMLAVVDDKTRSRVGKAIELAGGEVMRVELNASGVRIEKS